MSYKSPIIPVNTTVAKAGVSIFPAAEDHDHGALITPAALTKVDDTNVTLTLGGSPTIALINATSLTAGWTGTLAVGRGGTGTGTAFTQGSVIFAGASGVYSQNNVKFFWDDSTFRLGLGTAIPNEQLELTGNLRLPVTTSTVGQIKSGANLLFHTYGNSNIFLGIGAGNLTLTSSGNTGIGATALAGLTGGFNNNAIGALNLKALTSGHDNVAIGFNNMPNLTTGDNNVAIGSYALSSATFNGSNIVAIGSGAGASITTGGWNVAIGNVALATVTTGAANTAVGFQALQFGIGGGCVALGYGALRNTTGNETVGIGTNAGLTNTVGTYINCIGASADVGANNLTVANAFGSYVIVSDSYYTTIASAASCVGICGARRPTGTGGLIFPVGTALSGMVANTAGLYAATIALVTRMLAIDSAGVAHDLSQGGASGNSTGVGTASLGTNSPAITNTGPYTWLTMVATDGSTIYVPAWK